MSLNLEYLPLFIFVLTLTYKKKKKKKKKNKTQPETFWCWRRDGQAAHMSHRGVGTGPSDAVAPRPSSLNAQGRVSRLHSYVCTPYIRFRSFGTEPVLSWAHHVKSVAPFKCYVTLLINVSSLDQKDIWRS